MEFYHCRNCGWFFYKKHNRLPVCCPNCKEKSFMCEADKQMYIEWLQSYRDENLYRNTYTDVDEELIWSYLNIFWRNYDAKNVRGLGTGSNNGCI